MNRAFLTIAVAAVLSGAEASSARAQEAVSPEQLRAWMAEVSNHGRWGADDELGTLNLISPEKRIEAAGLVREGHAVSLAHDLAAGPNDNAFIPMGMEYMVLEYGVGGTASAERLDLVFHGWSYSHLDGLAHFGLDSTLYNGFGVDALTASGATRLGVEVMRDGIVSRGVLVDVPAVRGVDYLEPDDLITTDDLEAWEARTGVRVSEGDVLLVRTGRWKREQEVGPWSIRDAVAGLHPSVALWLHERGVAALGGDGTNDRNPSIVEGIPDPLHFLVLVGMGMPLFDNLDLEALAVAAEERSRWTFFFVASPLRVVGGSGSPVNPLAIF